MKPYKIIPALIIIFLSLGCSHNNELLIKNGNGGITERYIVSKDTNHNIEYISYYRNGTIKEEGNIHSGERVGFWKQYYSDGIIRWQGEYRNGKRELSSIDTTLTDRTEIIFKGFTKDNKYAFRLVSIDSISPDDLMYGTNNAEVTKIKNFDSCDFLIKPLNNDTIHLQIFALAKHGVFTLFDKKIDPSLLKKWKN